MFRAIALIVVLAVIFGAVYLTARPESTPAIGENEPDTPVQRLYDNATLGVRFSYPGYYVLSEREVGNGERSHYSIVLIDKTAAANIPTAGEGPPAITIDIFGNGIDKLPLKKWITDTSASNYKLALVDDLATSTVAEESAYSYTWDGLYRGESIVLAHGSNIVMLSVTYIDPAEVIRKDFSELIGTVRLQ